MRKILFFSLLTFCFLCSHCSESPENKPSNSASVTVPDSNNTALQSVCDCYDSAINILDDAIQLRKKFVNKDEYLADKTSVNEMKMLIKKWHGVQEHCLKAFGTQVYRDKSCDRADELSEKRDELKALGIKT